MPAFLFTDIEGSTQLWEVHGRVMGTALSRHDQILRDCIREHGGRIIKHTGDGVFAVFESGRPLECALAIQRRLAHTDWGPIGRFRVRIAINAGEAEERSGDYFGSVVNRTARLLYAAWGGQILLSDQVVRTFPLPPDSTLYDYGVHMLKDLGHPQQVFGLAIKGEEQEFPRLRSLSSRSHNLPPQPTPFIGRRRELGELLQQIAEPRCRLLTIVGSGGVGKTRLALQVAAESIDAYPHGVYQVTLAPLSKGDSLVTAVADALRFPFSGSGSPRQQLFEYLAEKEMMLVLDNFEHLVDSAGLVSDLLEKAVRLKVLVTSRERLNLSEEWTFELSGMEVPQNGSPQSAEQFGSVQLFLNHAYRVAPELTLTDGDIENIVRICKLVDGLPLGIELASSWVRVLDISEIVEEVGKGLDFLASSSPSLPRRQQSLRAVFDYSWQTLQSLERDVLRRLSVFRGGMLRDAAEAVAGATLPMLLALTDKSLLRRNPSGRYEMLEVIRQYASGKLDEDPAVALEARRLHTDFYIDLLHTYGALLTGGRQREALASLSAERENTHEAWQHVLEKLDVEAIHRGLEGVFHLYEMRGWMEEGLNAFDDAVAALAHAPHSRLKVITRAMAMNRRGWFAYRLGRHQAAQRDLRQSLAVFIEWNEPAEAALARYNLGVLNYQLGQYLEAELLLRESLRIQSNVNDRFGAARTLSILGIVARDQGNIAGAYELLEESLALHRAIDDKRGIARCLNLLALLHRDQKQVQQARLKIEESLAIAREVDDISGVAYALSLLGVMLYETGEYVAARDYARESLELREKIGDRRGITFSHNDLARALVQLERYDAAREHFCLALATADAIEARPLCYYVLASVAELERRVGNLEQALRLSALVLTSGTSFETAANCATEVFGRVKTALPPETVEAITGTTTIESYDPIISGVLEACGFARNASRQDG
jgi:predicted ATPase/class 3 adenylate cyclase